MPASFMPASPRQPHTRLSDQPGETDRTDSASPNFDPPSATAEQKLPTIKTTPYF